MSDFLGVPGQPMMQTPVGPVPHVVSQQPAAHPMLQSNPVYPGPIASLPVTNGSPASLEVPAATMLPGRFETMDDISPEEKASGETGVFVGDGTSFLEVPGLKRLRSIRIGHQVLPLVEPRSYPVNTAGLQQVVNEPLVALDRRANGTPVIIRSIISNDGRWPADTNIYVTGEWEAGYPEEAPKQAGSESSAHVPAAHSAQAQVTTQQNDAVTRQQVYQDTRNTGAATLEGNSPTLVDPIGAVRGTSAPPVSDPIAPDYYETAEDHATRLSAIEASQGANLHDAGVQDGVSQPAADEVPGSEAGNEPARPRRGGRNSG